MSHSPEFQQRVLELHAAQARGEAPPPGEISERQLAQAFGVSRRAIHADYSTGLAKIRKALFPDLTQAERRAFAHFLASLDPSSETQAD